MSLLRKRRPPLLSLQGRVHCCLNSTCALLVTQVASPISKLSAATVHFSKLRRFRGHLLTSHCAELLLAAYSFSGWKIVRFRPEKSFDHFWSSLMQKSTWMMFAGMSRHKIHKAALLLGQVVRNPSCTRFFCSSLSMFVSFQLVCLCFLISFKLLFTASVNWDGLPHISVEVTCSSWCG